VLSGPHCTQALDFTREADTLRKGLLEARGLAKAFLADAYQMCMNGLVRFPPIGCAVWHGSGLGPTSTTLPF
jgi:hypothetical protein